MSLPKADKTGHRGNIVTTITTFTIVNTVTTLITVTIPLMQSIIWRQKELHIELVIKFPRSSDCLNSKKCTTK